MKITSDQAHEKQLLNCGVIEAVGEALTQRGLEKSTIISLTSILKKLTSSYKSYEIIAKKSIASVIFRALENRTDIEVNKTGLELVEKILKDPKTAEEIV